MATKSMSQRKNEPVSQRLTKGALIEEPVLADALPYLKSPDRKGGVSA
jgi:hypothetical protein